MIQNADPTGERCPDPPEMASLEEECKGMNPLINQELEKIDRNHGKLMLVNDQLMEALQLYHNLMRELPSLPGFAHNTMSLPPSGSFYVPMAATSSDSQPPPSYMSLNQMFPSQAVSLGQIPQGITAQVGPSSLPATNVIPNRTSPPQMYQQQQQQHQGGLPTYYDVTQQQQQQQHAINNMVAYGPLNNLPMTVHGPASIPYGGVPGYGMSSPAGVSTAPQAMNQQTRLV